MAFKTIAKLIKGFSLWILLMLNLVFKPRSDQDAYSTWRDHQARSDLQGGLDLQNRSIQYCVDQPSDLHCISTVLSSENL